MDDDIVEGLLQQAVASSKGAADDIVLEDIREIRVPSSVLPPRDHAGVHLGMYEALFTNSAGDTNLSVFLPHTIVFTYGRPSAWYSTARDPESGRLVLTKRRATALKNTLILHTLLNDGAVNQDADPRLRAAAQKPKRSKEEHTDEGRGTTATASTGTSHVAKPKASRGRGGAVGAPCTPFIACFVSSKGEISYLDEASLKKLVLLAPSDERDGVLQQLVLPYGSEARFDAISAVWSPSVCCVDRRQAATGPSRTGGANASTTSTSAAVGSPGRRRRSRTGAATATDFQRMETFDGATYAGSTEFPVTSSKNLAAISTQGAAIATHFTDVTGGRYLIQSMNFTARLTRAGDLVFMWADAVRVAEIVPVPREEAEELRRSRSSRLQQMDTLSPSPKMGASLLQEAHATSSELVHEGTVKFDDDAASLVRRLIRSRLRHSASVAGHLRRSAVTLEEKKLRHARQQHQHQYGADSTSQSAPLTATGLSTGAHLSLSAVPTGTGNGPALALEPSAISSSPGRFSASSPSLGGLHGSPVSPSNARRFGAAGGGKTTITVSDDDLYYRVEALWRYDAADVGVAHVKQKPTSLGQTTCPLCDAHVSETQLSSFSYASLIEAAGWAPPSSPRPSPAAQGDLEPFTAASFTPVVDTTPSWARRAGEPPRWERMPFLAARNREVPPEELVGLPEFIRKLHPLMGNHDLALYNQDKLFRQHQVGLCTDCAMRLTEGLALKTDARLAEVSSVKRRGAANAADGNVRTSQLRVVADRDGFPSPSTTIDHGLDTIARIPRRKLMHPLSRALPRVQTPTSFVTKPGHLGPSSVKESDPARQRQQEQQASSPQQKRKILGDPGHLRARTTTPAPSGASVAALCDRLAMPSPMLGRPSSTQLVHRVRRETRLFAQRPQGAESHGRTTPSSRQSVRSTVPSVRGTNAAAGPRPASTTSSMSGKAKPPADDSFAKGNFETVDAGGGEGGGDVDADIAW